MLHFCVAYKLPKKDILYVLYEFSLYFPSHNNHNNINMQAVMIHLMMCWWSLVDRLECCWFLQTMPAEHRKMTSMFVLNEGSVSWQVN